MTKKRKGRKLSKTVEQIARAVERANPGISKSKKIAIAQAQANKSSKRKKKKK